MSGDIVVKSGRVNLDEWELPAFDLAGKLLPLVQEGISQAIECALRDGSYVFLPHIFRDGSESDPLSICLYLALDSGDGDGPVISFNLREMLEGTIQDCIDDGSWAEPLGRISAALKVLADDIDSGRVKWDTGPNAK